VCLGVQCFWGLKLKFIIKLLLIIVVAIAVVAFSLNNNGHVILLAGRFRMDISLIVAIVSIVITFLVCYYLIRIIVNLNRIPNQIKQWRQIVVSRSSRKYLNNAWISYLGGDYINAYASSIKSIGKETNRDNKFLSKTLAIKAASKLSDSQSVQKILIQLNDYSDKKWQLAKLSLTAESLYAKQEYSLCLDYLDQILKLDKSNIQAHLLSLKIYVKITVYDKAFMELSWLIAHKILKIEQIEDYRHKVLSGLFAGIADEAELSHFYRKLDKHTQKNGTICKFYFDALIKLSQYNTAIALIKSIHDKITGFLVDDSILLLAKKVTDTKQVLQLLEMSEDYLNHYKNSHALLLALGILNIKVQDWDRAKNYIEMGLMIRVCTDSYMYLSLIAIETQNMELAKYASGKLLENIHNLK
jgi:HemY protein